MSAAALYRSLGLKGYEVEDTWEGKNGALLVLVSVPRESLRCRSCGVGVVGVGGCICMSIGSGLGRRHRWG